jgi:hypothetical protein
MDAWNLKREPVRMAGDALNLPFADGSLRFVCAFQVLSQFMDIGSVFREVTRVLQPGGVFLFGEEPLRRKLSLRLGRSPYRESMKPWERKLFDWGLLGFVVRDVIGADQEESFGIRQNHGTYLEDWHALVKQHFAAYEFDVFVPERGWAERAVKRAAVFVDPHGSEWHAAHWLGGTLAAVCRKGGSPAANGVFDPFEDLLRCPDCHAKLRREADASLACVSCAYRSPFEEQVYNLLPSAERKELYPGQRDDIIDFSLPGHERQLLEGWHEVEGVFGNKYRWMGASASAQLRRVKPGPQKLRIRGFALPQGLPGKVTVTVNGARAGHWKLHRPGLFVLETDVPESAEYRVRIDAAPQWRVPEDERVFTVNISMIRLVNSSP